MAKKLIAGILFSGTALAALSSGALADERTAPVETAAPVSKVFVPTAFDDNDNIEIIAFGMFPTTCFRVGHSTASYDPSTSRIEIKVTAYEYASENCATVQTPFLETVKIGVLPEGNYDVRIAEAETDIQSFAVAKSDTDAPDSLLYAPVQYARYKKTNVGGMVVLGGEFPRLFRGCAIISEVRATQTTSELLEVLPIMEFIDDERCVDAPDTFHVETPVKLTPFTNGLMHIRVLNGRSMNVRIQEP